VSGTETKKRGLFGRLFGGAKPAPQLPPQPPVDETAEPTRPVEPVEEIVPLTEEPAFAAPPEAAVDAPPEVSPDVAVAEIQLTVLEAEEPSPELKSDPQPEPEATPEQETDDVPASLVPASLEAIEQSEDPGEIEVVAVVAPEPPPEAPAPRKSWLERLRQGLARTSSKLAQGITGLFAKRKLDDETIEDLEDLLIQSDLGVDTAARIVETLKKTRYNKDITAEEVRDALAAEVERTLAPVAVPLVLDEARRPHVILVVGVNGVGKTTTIGKMAKQFSRDGKSVMLAAGDTFRAAAIDQLKIWGQRTGAPVISGLPGADAAGLSYDALQAAQAQNCDVLIIDTAGRLQNKAYLMAELEKIARVLKKVDPEAPHSVILALDATTGQNALNQVEIFSQICGVTGIVMNKLDGTARGGILVAIAAKHKLPVHAIGVGEGVDDMQPFDASEFAQAIANA
jgi:fused signal recognition particle receptor